MNQSKNLNNTSNCHSEGAPAKQAATAAIKDCRNLIFDCRNHTHHEEIAAISRLLRAWKDARLSQRRDN